MKIKDRTISRGQPYTFVIAEIGINHNGDLSTAKSLIDVAFNAGCDAVKFQKRTVELVYSEEELDKPRESPWGTTTREQKMGLEFGLEEYQEIDRYCKEKGILWSASCWDIPSLEFILQFDPPFLKIASACLTYDDLVKKHAESGIPIIMSVGMSTTREIEHAIGLIVRHSDHIDRALLHTVSVYPAQDKELNLSCIGSMLTEYPYFVIGYSGHEKGISPSVAAVALGARIIERHITLDRTSYGSDQAASLEPKGITRLVRDIRSFEASFGDGKRVVSPGELANMRKLRKHYSSASDLT